MKIRAVQKKMIPQLKDLRLKMEHIGLSLPDSTSRVMDSHH